MVITPIRIEASYVRTSVLVPVVVNLKQTKCFDPAGRGEVPTVVLHL